MTPEDKELLYTDLCQRLPYGVRINVRHRIQNDCTELEERTLTPMWLAAVRPDRIGDITPYLRPMGSMTKEEHKELTNLINDESLLTGDPAQTVCLHCGVVIDFHNAHHLDWRGLIPRNLAIEAPEGMYNN